MRSHGATPQAAASFPAHRHDVVSWTRHRHGRVRPSGAVASCNAGVIVAIVASGWLWRGIHAAPAWRDRCTDSGDVSTCSQALGRASPPSGGSTLSGLLRGTCGASERRGSPRDVGGCDSLFRRGRGACFHPGTRRRLLCAHRRADRDAVRVGGRAARPYRAVCARPLAKAAATSVESLESHRTPAR